MQRGKIAEIFVIITSMDDEKSPLPESEQTPAPAPAPAPNQPSPPEDITWIKKGDMPSHEDSTDSD